MNKKRVVLADDHTLFRNGLKILINSRPEFTVACEVANGVELLDALAKDSYDVVLLDIQMPEMDGFEAARIIKERYPDLPLITLSMFGEEDYYFKMVEMGVKGFLLKNSEFEEVCNALTTVVGGGTYFSQELLLNLVNNFQYNSSTPSDEDDDTALSQREQEILVLICKGLSNKEIGELLFISKRTVDKHRANILVKTNCKNTANLVVYAITNSIVDI